eukprot:CAMPEP_0169389832 /NCGR_PEP_ID=MMETSP1017-20121227/46980_1 /TAXON_ID=342587 /ORGANISM="Karlodinium micrum, Strain CCMP2283" /LENGTH=58 /DNA_ID=CAMNT_0009492101 /DNA_START=326 /DNA_END=500 /DNA_ORIENTATION=-
MGLYCVLAVADLGDAQAGLGGARGPGTALGVLLAGLGEISRSRGSPDEVGETFRGLGG